MEDEDDNLVLNKPELGIYDTRAWDSQYKKWVNQQGPNPGKHPDPDCIWN